MAEFLQALQATDPVAFTIGPFAARWYGLSYLAGFLAATALAWHFAKKWKLSLSFDDLLTVLISLSLGVIIGSRVGFVLFYQPAYFLANPLQIIAFWDGGISGMSFHGGLIGAIIGAYIAARLIKMPLLRLGDLVLIGTPIGLAFGRLSNYINGELWGRVTDVSWGVVFPAAAAGDLARHPSQLYEGLLQGVLMFAVLLTIAIVYARKGRPPVPGTIAGTFLVLYGIVRIFAENFREPDSQLGFLLGNWLTMGMLLSLPMVIVGAAILWHAWRNRAKLEDTV
ncbi:MAG: prolipoprotein diacylglyceryl transferase [Coriobacteriia bacterium]|nr:prolipoprotein diacylglyceryl transferase [Coriobacteriia bacterium]MCL2536917.1 prolipoprotein diacylglyceryl transferase [Coriobacteriia bacterium]